MKPIMLRPSLLRPSLLVALATASLLCAAAPETIPFPADYREWVFLSSGLGMTYGPLATPPANPSFDNVFVKQAAHKAFLQTGKWPDGTMFVLEVRGSASQGSINKGGHFQTEAVVGIEAEVKKDGKWTFYGFGTEQKPGKIFPSSASCYACHSTNAAVDNTFVQFYPTLLPIAKAKGTLRASAEGLKFAEHTIATDLKGGYQTVVADLNRDGKPDIIALASGLTELAWYENPTWERHVLVSNFPRSINCAAEDIDGDGIPEIVVAWAFENDAAKSLGKVGVLTHGADPRQPWTLREIDKIPTSHRIRWADIDGSGKKVAINAPLTGVKASPPEYTQDHAPLVFYRPGDWKRQVISDANLGVQHGIFVTKWNPGDKQDSLITSSFSGLHLLQREKNGAWTRTELTKGDAGTCPKCGSSDAAVGYLGHDKFIAAIEAWHGTQVAVYSQKGKAWQRTVIDDSLTDGHTVSAADLDGDGRDEIVASFRQGTKSVFLYKARANGWDKQLLDSAMGAAACSIADLNADHTNDITCISGTTLKWYQNLRPATMSSQERSKRK